MLKLEGESLRDHLIDWFRLNLAQDYEEAEENTEEIIEIIEQHLDEIETW